MASPMESEFPHHWRAILWWDEFAVDTVPGSPNYGKALPNRTLADQKDIIEHRHWLGQPLGPYTRLYDDAEFAPGKASQHHDFNQGLDGFAKNRQSAASRARHHNLRR